VKGAIVLGGGLTGLSCARHLRAAGAEVAVYEREDRVGGVARTEHRDGFHFDHAGHLLHLRTGYGKALVGSLFPEAAFLDLERRARIFSKGVYTEYPFQARLHGLPPAVVAECLLGFIEVATAGDTRTGEDSFAAWCRKTFGEGIARHFLLPFNEKLWRRNLEEVTTDWVSWAVPRPSLEDVVEGALGMRAGTVFGYNPTFLYPREGGIEMLARRLADGLGVRTGREAAQVDLDRRVLVLADGEEVGWERLVSTIPLPDLLERCRPLPDRVREGAAGLAWVDVHVFNVGVRGAAPTDAHWIYVPEPEFPFYRVGVASNVSAAVAPEGHHSLYVETSRRPDEAVDPEALLAEVLEGLGRTGLLPDPERVVMADHLAIRPAYVVHDRHRREALPDLLGFLEERGVLSVGRYGAWTYSSMEDALNQGREAAERVLGRPAPLVEEPPAPAD